MNGPEHYREAEGALRAIRDDTHTDAEAAILAVVAQAHAKLAQVAAYVEAEALRGWEVAR